MSPKNRLRHATPLIVAGVLLIPVLAACGSDGSSASKSSSNGSSSTSSAEHDMSDMSAEDMAAMGHDTNTAGDDVVNIKLIAYKPGTLEVPVGTTVTWKQMDPGTHTVTSGTVDAGSEVTIRADDELDSGEIATGKSFSRSFDTPGTYSYFCRIHPATMQGEITVR